MVGASSLEIAAAAVGEGGGAGAGEPQARPVSRIMSRHVFLFSCFASEGRPSTMKLRSSHACYGVAGCMVASSSCAAFFSQIV